MCTMFQVCIHAEDCRLTHAEFCVVNFSHSTLVYTENCRLVEDGLKHSQVVKITKHGKTELGY